MSIFYKLGYYSSAHPWVACIFSLTLTTIFGLGMYNLHLETDPQNLWVSPASRTFKEQQDFSENFGPFYRTNQFMLLPSGDTGEFVFDKTNKAGLYVNSQYNKQVIYFLQQIINNKYVEYKGKNITLDDLCFKPVSGKGCLSPSPMDIWLQEPSLLEKDLDLQHTTLCTESIDPARTNIPCSDVNGIPVIREAVFGGMISKCQERNPDDQPCEHCYIQSQALSVTYLLNNGKFSSEDAARWELDVYMETMRRFNDRDYDWLSANYFAKQPPPAKEVMDQFQLVYLSERSVSDELAIETNQNLWVVILSYILMFIYISIALGDFPSKIHNGFLLGFGGILIVAFSMIGSIGLVSYMKIGLTMISAEVIPFLILAIGVDNMFIITHAFQRIHDSISLQDKMGKTLATVGPSITTAAICETSAFLVGALTKMPALQNFCLQAAFGVMLDYIFQITLFVAFLTWDEIRKREGRLDCLFCITAADPAAPPNRKIAQTIIQKYTKVLLTTPCKIATLVVFLTLFAISCIGVYKLENGLEEQVSMVSKGDLDNYFTYEKKYIEIGPPAYLVLKGFNYSDQKDVAFVNGIANALSQLESTVQPPIFSWVSGFNLFLNPSAEWTSYCGTADILLDDFPTQLNRFINTKITSSCCQRFGICGETFQADIVTDDQGYVKTSRLRFQHRPIHNSKEYILTLEQTRQVIDKLSVDLPAEQSVYAYSLPYIFYDQYSYIKAVAIQNVLLALATIFFTVTIIQDTISAIIVCVVVFIISFNLIGLVWLLNVIFGGFQIQINAISVVNLVTCLGLAVEFCVHMVIKFRMTIGDRKHRIQYAMATMGTSVLVGIASTKFIGVIVLAFASSTLFRLYYFRMYILMVITGTFNGLCLLPVFLSLLGPRSKVIVSANGGGTTDSDNPASSVFRFNQLN